MIEIKNKDLDKILLLIKYMMENQPELNESLMDFYCYLREMKSPNPTNDSTNDSTNDRNDDLKRITIEESTGVDMNLDEMIWNLGMSLPSWDDLQSK